MHSLPSKLEAGGSALIFLQQGQFSKEQVVVVESPELPATGRLVQLLASLPRVGQFQQVCSVKETLCLWGMTRAQLGHGTLQLWTGQYRTLPIVDGTHMACAFLTG